MNKNVSIQDQCLEVLATGPMTADEVASKIGESILAVRPSICMLYKGGLVAKSGDKKANASGKLANVWVLRKDVKSNGNEIEVGNFHNSLVKQSKELGFSAAETMALLKESVPADVLAVAIKNIFA